MSFQGYLHYSAFVCLLYQFSYKTHKTRIVRVSAALGVLPAIAMVVSRLCNGTHGWHWQRNKSKQAQLNRNQKIWVRSQFLKELLKKETSSSPTFEHFYITWKTSIKHPAQSALVAETTGMYLLCHRIIILHKSLLFLINGYNILIPASHASYFFLQQAMETHTFFLVLFLWISFCAF